MKEMNVKDYPYNYLITIQSVFQSIRKQVEINSDKIRIVYDDDLTIIVEDLDYKSKFKYTIEKPQLKDGKVLFEVSFTPKSTTLISEHKMTLEGTGGRIVETFKSWINLISNYQNINIHPHNNVLKNYQNEIFNSFKFIDNDNGDKPLNYKEQREISKFLNLLVVELENEEGENDDIIEEIKYLNSNITKLTQNQIKNKLSWCFAKMWYKGIDVINKISRVGVDAGIGYLLIEGVKSVMK